MLIKTQESRNVCDEMVAGAGGGIEPYCDSAGL